jgi:biopolymer transport protein ExbB
VVVAKTISLDGWIIIGILVIMSALTWIVFFNKMIYLRQIKKENAAFATAFSRTRGLLEMKEAEDQYPNASMFRVYSGAAEELERRLENSHEFGGKKSLAAEAKTIIRSALDKGSLQESKKNTGGLIVLTMGISGGPFLGLLGTVWGVMNTFAGVAEAGEANLAAIAPGVASALACTLAGLVVAIPALFAYSYLSSEIKNLAADMNVFMDEFMMRVDEGFGSRHE